MPGPSSPPQMFGGSRFAATALIIFTCGSVLILLLEFAERSGLIGNLTESSSRLVVWSAMIAFLLIASRPLSMWPRIVVFGCSFFLLIDSVVDVVEDIDSLRWLPIVGGNSRWRHSAEKVIVACWGCGIFFLLYLLVCELEFAYSELRKRAVDQEKARVELQRTVSKLQEAQVQVVQNERLAALGQMASGVAHDLNNALTPVMVCSDFLKQNAARYEDDLKALEMIETGAAHVGQVVQQLQYFYRGHAEGTLSPNQGVALISELVRKSVELTRFRWHDEALRKGLTYDIELDIPDHFQIYANSTELIQLMTNLLFNAIDAMPNGGRIVVSVGRADGLIQICVSDNGHGMSKDQRQRCFEPFFTTKGTGSGLGLSVCHGIARRHGGQIKAYANTGGGSKFVVNLPDYGKAVLENKVVVREKKGVSRHQILVVDDDEIVLSSIAAYLRFFGSNVDTAKDGAQGIELAKKTKYNLVITDLGMPVVTGRDVVRQIKRHDPNMVVAVASGWSRRAVAEEFDGEAEKPDFILQKPVLADSLKEMLLDL